MKELGRMIKSGPLRMVIYVVLFCFGFFALIPRVADATLVVDKGKVMNIDREQALAQIKSVLERKEVKSKLESMGMNAQDIEKRLSLLSDEDIHKLAKNIDALNPGGDAVGFVIGLLIIVLLVLLILYLTGNLDWSVKVEKKDKKKEK